MPSKSRTRRPTQAIQPPEGDLPLSPGPKARHPWSFRLGEWVHARGFGGLTVRIESGFLHRSMPHYVVRTTTGDVWRLPQIHLSTRAI